MVPACSTVLLAPDHMACIVTAIMQMQTMQAMQEASIFVQGGCMVPGRCVEEQLYKHDVRAQVRKAQIGTGDREVFMNEQGERMSRLREVDSDWIIRRLERWGRRVRRMGPQSPFFLSCLINLALKEPAILAALTQKGSTRSAQHLKSSK